MHDKITKISVLRKMIGLGEHYVVPQNSVLHIAGKPRVLSEVPNEPPSFTLQPPAELECTVPTTQKCGHCESMVKNLLYVESLIRNNLDTKRRCAICLSTLKHLEGVNKRVLEVFSNFESVKEAARAYANMAVQKGTDTAGSRKTKGVGIKLPTDKGKREKGGANRIASNIQATKAVRAPRAFKSRKMYSAYSFKRLPPATNTNKKLRSTLSLRSGPLAKKKSKNFSNFSLKKKDTTNNRLKRTKSKIAKAPKPTVVTQVKKAKPVRTKHKAIRPRK